MEGCFVLPLYCFFGIGARKGCTGLAFWQLANNLLLRASPFEHTKQVGLLVYKSKTLESFDCLVAVGHFLKNRVAFIN